MNKKSISELRALLSKESNLICFEDLSDFFGNHSAIYTFLSEKRKNSFNSNDRLVFYTSNILEQDFINHIQKAIAAVDIGNFFITLVTRNSVSQELQLANNLFCQDEHNITNLEFDIEDTKLFETKGFIAHNETFCVLPFVELDVTSGNTVKPCCKYSGTLGDLRKNTAKEIFYGISYNELRDSFKRGEKSKSCINCWDVESKGGASLRTLTLDKYEKYTNFHDVYNHPKLLSVNLQPGNLCNFKCRICLPKNSSSIIVEELSHTNNTLEKKNFKRLLSLNSPNTELIKNNIIPELEGVEYLHLAGGETLLWPPLAQSLDTMINLGFSKNIRLEFNTNCSVFSKEILDKLLNFKRVEILLSIDDINERFEIQRGGAWSEIFKNILLYKSYVSPTFSIKIQTTINIQNILYLDEIYKFFTQLDIPILWWHLEEPEVLSIDRVTQRVKELVIDLYHTHPDPELKALANRMSLTTPVSGQEFIDYCDKLDSRRKQDFKRSHREIYDAMSEYNLYVS